MCASCGCGRPEDQHDDPRNIKLSDLEAAAAAANTDVNGVLNNLQRMVSEATSQSGSTGEQGR